MTQPTLAPQTLPLARYRYTYRMAEALRLPHYAGSLLRGQFGASLRRISCMTQASECTGCPLRGTCPYPTVFETPAPQQHDLQRFSHVPNPYVLEPPLARETAIAAGEAFSFNLVLIGRALEHLPLISFALQRAIEQGLGPRRARGVLERIEVQNSAERSQDPWIQIWQHGSGALAPHDALRQGPQPAHAPAPSITQAQLHFDTPLRLQQQGRPLRPQELSPRKLIADLLRRITLLAEFHADRPHFIPEVSHLVQLAAGLQQEHDLRWQDWTRYSSRQQQEMKLGGVVGAWTLRGELAPLLPWLHLGQWLHIGKNATLGLGAYRLLTGR